MTLEKISDIREIRQWSGHMETDYIYTLGSAGERFFNEIKKNARIMGVKCKKCDIVYVPPRIYCERCFEKLDEWIEVGKQGTVYTYTVAHINLDGTKLKEPTIYAMIKMEGADGGLIHKIAETTPEKVEIGMRVEAVFKPREKREGSINDIKYFRPIK